MSAEQLDLENLRGKSILDVVSVLPALSWREIDFGHIKALNSIISCLRFVIYDTKLPRVEKSEPDFPFSVEVSSGILMDKEKLTKDVLSKEVPGRTIGIVSAVYVDAESIGPFMQGKMKLSPDLNYYTLAPLRNSLYGDVHIPFIDIEVDENNLSQERLLSKIKFQIKQKTKTNQGVILCSGRENHFHFIGMDRLLGREKFVTFIGHCLDMDIEGKPIVDPFWAGHCLTTSMGRCATLRITTNEIKKTLPTVVDILD